MLNRDEQRVKRDVGEVGDVGEFEAQLHPLIPCFNYSFTVG